MSLKRNGSGCFDFTAFKAIMNMEGSEKMEVLKGDIFYIQKGGRVTGSEQYPERPAVVVSNNVGNEHSGIVEVVYLTSQPKKDLPTHAKVVCSVPSVALCEQINTVSKERLGSYIRTCTEKEMADIDAALKISLGLENDNSNLEAKDAEVEKLKEQLKEAGAKIKELKSELKTKEETSNKAELDKTELDIYTIQIETERDLYKEQYEALLERLINQ